MSTNISEENIIKDVANRFRIERLRLELSQDDLAKLCGVSSRSVISWENGVKIPSHHLAQLARHNFDTEFVLTGKTKDQASLPRNMKMEKMAQLMEGLTDDQQREIFTVIEKNKRLNELEEKVFQLQKKVG